MNGGIDNYYYNSTTSTTAVGASLPPSTGAQEFFRMVASSVSAIQPRGVLRRLQRSQRSQRSERSRRSELLVESSRTSLSAALSEEEEESSSLSPSSRRMEPEAAEGSTAWAEAVSLERRDDLYRLLFNVSGKRLTLEDKHILDVNVESNNSKVTIEEQDGDGSKGDDGAVLTCLSIDVESEIEDESDGEKKPSRRVVGVGCRSCVICLEEFAVGDDVVWSADECCPHVYHEECMARYLARNAQKNDTRRLDVTNNPCPVCRRNYCGIKRHK